MGPLTFRDDKLYEDENDASSDTARTLQEDDFRSSYQSRSSKPTGGDARPRSTLKSFRHFSVQPPKYGETEADVAEPAGMEPGINVETTKVKLANAIGSEVTVVDFCPERFSSQFADIYANSARPNTDIMERMLVTRPKWSKVRWISVNGLSWEVIEPITRYFNLHPLAVEDMLDIPQRTKFDVFANHMFCCFPLHILGQKSDKQGRRAKARTFCNTLRSLFSQLEQDDIERNPTSFPMPSSGPRNMRCSATSCVVSPLKMLLQEAPGRTMYQWDLGTSTENVAPMGRDYNRNKSRFYTVITVEQVTLFMTEDTVISLFEKNASKVEEPVLARISSEQTLLRQTSDPAILTQAIIDTSVDLLGPIITAYGRKLTSLQAEAIESPTLNHTRALHLLTTDITILLSSVTSLASMVNSIRAKAAENHESAEESRLWGHVISETAGTYFADVYDHTMSFATRLGIMSEQAKSLTTMIFNTISLRSNDAVRLLSLVTVVFLPLSFLTGYFGMNFTKFTSLNNDVAYYWSIAGPCTAGLMVFLTYGWVYEKFLEWRRWFRIG